MALERMEAGKMGEMLRQLADAIERGTVSNVKASIATSGGRRSWDFSYDEPTKAAPVEVEGLHELGPDELGGYTPSWPTS